MGGVQFVEDTETIQAKSESSISLRGKFVRVGFPNEAWLIPLRIVINRVSRKIAERTGKSALFEARKLAVLYNDNSKTAAGDLKYFLTWEDVKDYARLAPDQPNNNKAALWETARMRFVEIPSQ